MFNPKNLRKIILDMAYNGNSCHIGCAFSIVEILSVLYSHFPNDHIVLSKGHGVMAQYACLAELGIINKEQLDNYFKDGSKLKGLSDCHVPGLEVSSGSLGHGLSVAVGIALANKLNNIDKKVFCIVGDGECNAGPIWESIMFAAHHKLNNLIIIVDSNGFQAMGETKNIMNLDYILGKFAAFGIFSFTCDGHNTTSLKDYLDSGFRLQSNNPLAIIAQTIKGKGISFMENDNSWHYKRLTEEQYKLAILELETVESMKEFIREKRK